MTNMRSLKLTQSHPVNKKVVLPITLNDGKERNINSTVVMPLGDFSKCSERQKRFLALESILLILESADRLGQERDEPEGVRYIQISETLVAKMVNTIYAYIDSGVEYLRGKK